MQINYPATAEQWGVWEISLKGRTEGNPFTDYPVAGVFTSKNETKRTEGFYDGNGIYKVRFMPSFAETYTFTITGDCLEAPVSGSFTVEPAKDENHGPVRVCGDYHFAYADPITR